MKFVWMWTTILTMREKAMALNNIQPVGDDQAWKAEVERIIRDLQNQVAVLKAQLNSRNVV